MKILLFTLFLSCSAFAETIQEIKVIGNNKTGLNIILQELGIKEHQNATKSEINKGIQNLKNTRLFSKVSYKLVPKDDTKATLIINLEEKWTTIPILKFQSGGGVSQLTAGVYDPHVYGQYTELGAQFQKLDDTNSGVAWLKKPRILGGKYSVDFQVWELTRLRTKYVQGIDERVPKNGFLHTRTKLYGAITKKVKSELEIGAFYEYNHDRFSDRLVPPEVIETQVDLPPSSIYHFLGASMDLGKVNRRQHLADGNELNIKLRRAFSFRDNLSDFFDGELTYNYYKTFRHDFTFAQRVMAGATTTDVLQYWWYLGGLDRVRGYADNRFSGRYFLLSNSEIRYAAYYSKYVVLQPVIFTDLVSTSEKISAIDRLDGANIGTGLRINFPQIYRFVGRIDYAKPLVGDGYNKISLGVQQFF